MSVIYMPKDTRYADASGALANTIGQYEEQKYKQKLLQLMEQQKQQQAEQAFQHQKELIDYRAKASENAKRDYINSIFGGYYNADVPTADGSLYSVHDAGMINPDNTGLTPQLLNQMKLQALTGVRVPRTKPKVPLSAYGKYAYDLGITPTEQGFRKWESMVHAFDRSSQTPKVTETRIGKLIKEMNTLPKNSSLYKIYQDRLKYLTQPHIDPMSAMMMHEAGVNAYGEPLNTTSDTNSTRSVFDLMK